MACSGFRSSGGRDCGQPGGREWWSQGVAEPYWYRAPTHPVSSTGNPRWLLLSFLPTVVFSLAKQTWDLHMNREVSCGGSDI